MNDWYEAVDCLTRITQGDLISDCPILFWEGDKLGLAGEGETEVLKDAVSAITADVIVMSQACDLEHEKVDNVVICPHMALMEYRVVWQRDMTAQKNNPSEKAWKRFCDDVCDGYVWNLSMLNEAAVGGLTTTQRIVDFRDIYSVPRKFLEALITKRRKPRLRLLPPYREHLSQAFARFFMRVGLPTPVVKGW